MKVRLRAETFPAPVFAETVLQSLFAAGQKYFFDHLLHIQYAHCLMLEKQNILTRGDARAILKGLDSLDRKKLRLAGYDGTVEDLYFYIERELIRIIGEENAGKLHLARSRNDIDVTQYRMQLRAELLDLIAALLDLQRTITALAASHTQTVMPAHTHTQPAQPTTLAHYLSAVIEFIARDTLRLRAAFATTNRCPLGACAITTTSFPIDRAETATLLGFEGIAENSYGAIGAVDYVLEAASALTISMLSLGKFTQDLLLWATQEYAYIRLGDAYVQTSSIMPQKRNPVALEHVRVLLSRAVGQAQAAMICTHNTPFGDINDSEDPLQLLVYQAFSDARRAVRLLDSTIGAIHVDVPALRRKAGEKCMTMTELADTLVRTEDLGFKMAHRLVSQTVSRLSGKALPGQLAETLDLVARETLGHPLRITRSDLEASLCPVNFVRVRRVLGGPAPEVVEVFLRNHRSAAEDSSQWLKNKRTLVGLVPAKLLQKTRRILSAKEISKT